MSKFNLDGKEALSTIRTLIAEVENLKTSMKNINKANASSFDALERGLKSTKDKVGLLTNKMNHLEAIMRKNASSTNKDSKASNDNAKAKKKQADATDKASKAQKSQNKAVSKGVTGIGKMNASVLNLLKAFGLLTGIQTFIKIAKNIYENIKTFDSLNFAMEKITKTSQNYENSQRFIINLTKDFGVELVPTTERWIKFLAAAEQSGLALRETENIFRSMTKAASVLGLQTDEMTQVYLALEQMLSKGKVTTEELRRQLGERLPGAMGIMAASMGKTIPELDKMMKQGQVLSAEVLPNFAVAVEAAYGIETVTKIQTITAEQNRLAAAWQSFIKSISEGDSIIKKTLGSILSGLTYITEAFEFIFQDDEQRMRVRIARMEEELRLDNEMIAQSTAAQARGFKDRQALLEEYEKRKAALQNAGNKEEKDAAQKSFDEITKIRAEVGKAANEQLVADASATLETYKKEVESARAVYDEFMEEMKKPVRNTSVLTGIKKGPTPEGGFRDLSKFNENDTEESLRAALVIYEAMYNVARKLVQISDVNIIDDKNLEVAQRNLRSIKDLALEIKNAISSQIKSGLEGQLKDEKKSIEERIDLIQKIADQERSIAKNTFRIKERDLNDSLIKEQESLEKSVNEGKLSRQKFNDFIVAANKEKDQKLEIAAIKLQKKLDDIQSKSSAGLNIVSDDADSISIDKIQDKYNIKIAGIKKVFNESAKTAKDQKKLDKELRDVSVKMANEIIQAKIDILEASIKGADQDSEWVQQIKRDINDLKAAISTGAPTDNDSDKWEKYWDSILDYAREAVATIGDIVDGIFSSRIENINAEIEAERDKYDALITLARDDDEERQTLERNRDARIKQLEKKRLKEQQKQAKAKKAFAIADISIKTAQAIMGIWADFPKIDAGISATLATVLVSALGAAQITAVLAQPIPKYKDGTNVEKEHKGIINDNMWQEYIERDGNILTTSAKNAIVNLKPGDTVYKNYDDMTRKSLAFNSMLGGQYVSQNDFNRYFLGMESAISRGFKNVKINNKNQISVAESNNSYREQMSYW